MVYENSKSCRYQIEVVIQLSKIQKTYRDPVCFVKNVYSGKFIAILNKFDAHFYWEIFCLVRREANVIPAQVLLSLFRLYPCLQPQ